MLSYHLHAFVEHRHEGDGEPHGHTPHQDPMQEQYDALMVERDEAVKQRNEILEAGSSTVWAQRDRAWYINEVGRLREALGRLWNEAESLKEDCEWESGKEDDDTKWEALKIEVRELLVDVPQLEGRTE